MLSVIGDDISQLIPLFYAYRREFEYHILLCDSSTHSRAANLRRGMLRFAASYGISWKIDIQSVEEDKLFLAVEQVEKSIDGLENLWLNVSDAYPMLTILLSDLVQKRNGKVVSYDHFSNTLHFLDPIDGLSCTRLSPRLTLHAYMMLLNYRIVSQQSSSSLLSRKESVLKLYDNPARFAKLRVALLSDDSGFEYVLYRDLMSILEDLGIVSDGRMIPSRKKVLGGDLFEEYLFWLCEALGADDIAMGVKIDFDDGIGEADANRHIFNEFDILMIHNNRIFTVECKFARHLDGLEVIYKYDAIIDYFGKASKAIIANISNMPKEKYLGMKSSENFRYSALRRARLSGIYVYHESQVDVEEFQSLVKSFFHLGGEDVG